MTATRRDGEIMSKEESSDKVPTIGITWTWDSSSVCKVDWKTTKPI